MASMLSEAYVASTAKTGAPDRRGSEGTFKEYFRFLALALFPGIVLVLAPLACALMLVLAVCAFGLVAGLV